jgi:hypothetical protein
VIDQHANTPRRKQQLAARFSSDLGSKFGREGDCGKFR